MTLKNESNISLYIINIENTPPLDISDMGCPDLEEVFEDPTIYIMNEIITLTCPNNMIFSVEDCGCVGVGGDGGTNTTEPTTFRTSGPP